MFFLPLNSDLTWIPSCDSTKKFAAKILHTQKFWWYQIFILERIFMILFLQFHVKTGFFMILFLWIMQWLNLLLLLLLVLYSDQH